MIKTFLLFVLVGCVKLVEAQQPIPVIRATSKDVTVIDGNHFRKGYWYIMPEKRPDYYLVENPKKAQRVVFITDLDSISFDVTPDKEYDFVILLNGKDSCFTRISTMIPSKARYHRNCSNCKESTDTIPFTIGLDNKTYLKARLNKGKPMTFQFDLGATHCVVDQSIAAETGIIWEGTATMGSVQGSEEVRSSQYNTIHLGKLSWDSIPLFSTQKTGWRNKGILGNSILQEQIIELNYDLEVMVMHHQPPVVNKGFYQTPFEMHDGVPCIPITIDNGKTKSTHWFVFDNGYSNSLLVDKEFAKANALYGTMKSLGSRTNPMNGRTQTVEAPKLMIGNYVVENVPIDLQLPEETIAYDRVIAGNDLLKRFNVIINFQENMIYFSPNTLMDEPYDKANKWLLRMLWIIGPLLVIGVYFLLKRWLRNRSKSLVKQR